MQTKWLTVFILLAATSDRQTTAKKNILDDLLFMGVNQLDRDLLTRVDMAKMKDSSLWDDLIRLFDPDPREVTGIDLPINPIPMRMVQITKLLFAFTPIDVDPIIEHTQAFNGLTNTLVLGIDGISHFVHDIGGAVIQQIGNISQPTPKKTEVAIPVTKTKPGIIESGMNNLASVVGKLMGKSKESSNKTTNQPTVKPDIKEPSKQKPTENVSKNKGILSFLNGFLNKTKSKPSVKQTTGSPDVAMIPTTPDYTMIPEFNPGDALIPEYYGSDDVEIPASTLATPELEPEVDEKPKLTTTEKPSKSSTSKKQKADKTTSKLNDIMKSVFGKNGTLSKYG